jgi:hypothetical protein
MKDGWIGLYKLPTATQLPDPNKYVYLNDCDIDISELFDDQGEALSLTRAQITLSNLDIVSPVNNKISGIQIDYLNSSDYTNQTTDLLASDIWLSTEYAQLDSSFGFNGINQIINIIAKSIPANPSTFYHKFRFSFYDINNEQVFITPKNNLQYTGIWNSNDYTLTLSSFNDTKNYIGFEAQLYDVNGKLVLTAPVIKHTNNVLTFPTGIVPSKSPVLIKFKPAKYYYALGNILGSEGTGYAFNSINDFNELMSVLDLAIETAPDVWSSVNNNPGILLPNTSLSLRWKNMYNHASTDVVNATGDDVTITNQQWKSVTGYAIYMYKATDSSFPSAGNYPGSTGESNGEWFKLGEINDIRSSISDKPTYEFLLEGLPLDVYTGFWVGAFAPSVTGGIRTLKLKHID